MSNQGLSIFDNEPEDSGDEVTQVIPRGDQGKSGAEQPQARPKSAVRVAEKPAPAPAAPKPAPARPKPAPAPNPATAAKPTAPATGEAPALIPLTEF